MWRRRQRLEWCVHKPRNTKDCQQLPEARREAQNGFSRRASRRNQSADTLISASKTTIRQISVLSYQLCSNMLWQPWETNTLLLVDPGWCLGICILSMILVPMNIWRTSALYYSLWSQETTLPLLLGLPFWKWIQETPEARTVEKTKDFFPASAQDLVGVNLVSL